MNIIRLEPYIDFEQANQQIDKVSTMLRTYHQTSGDNSEVFESYRNHDLYLARLTLTNLHCHLDPEFEIVINTGPKEVIGTRLRTDPYDQIYRYEKRVDAETTIEFTRIEDFYARGSNKSSFFIGNYVVMFELPVIGEILHNQGEIMLSKSKQHSEHPTSNV